MPLIIKSYVGPFPEHPRALLPVSSLVSFQSDQNLKTSTSGCAGIRPKLCAIKPPLWNPGTRKLATISPWLRDLCSSDSERGYALACGGSVGSIKRNKFAAAIRPERPGMSSHNRVAVEKGKARLRESFLPYFDQATSWKPKAMKTEAVESLKGKQLKNLRLPGGKVV